jgi:vacuolar-type H+-ATPase subunit E/Vma4
MTSPDAILQVIKESEERYRNVLKKALEESLNIVEAELEEAKAEGKRMVEKGEEEGKKVYRQLVTHAELKAKGELLESFEKSIDVLIDKAIEDIDKVSKGRYKRALSRFLDEALESIGEEIIVQAGRKDVNLLKELIRNLKKEKKVKVIISGKSLNVDHGFIAKSKDGRVSVEFTFEYLKERLKPIIRRRVVEKYLKEVLG